MCKKKKNFEINIFYKMATFKNNLNERNTKTLTLALIFNMLILKMSNLFSSYFTGYRNRFIHVKFLFFKRKICIDKM